MGKNVRLVLLRAARPLLVKAAVLSGLRGRERTLALLNRTLVYLALTVVVGAVYFGVGALDALLGS
ncbi:hypothetical protein DMB42_34280 [Nonomuraea sp. WAC 01424]|nr:hypothetical protein [Nonomuraea sp. WAC 01424]RSN02918.1 hypothetical protein DMB42_34280 [Nonomuraea sp. WAC 01424]